MTTEMPPSNDYTNEEVIALVPCLVCNVPKGNKCRTLQKIPMVLIHRARGNKYRQMMIQAERRAEQARENLRRQI